jgi:excisionase family DNA binding protein
MDDVASLGMKAVTLLGSCKDPAKLERVIDILSGRPVETSAEISNIRLLKVTDAAIRMNVSRATIYRKIHDNSIAAFQMPGGNWLVREMDLEQFCNNLTPVKSAA